MFATTEKNGLLNVEADICEGGLEKLQRSARTVWIRSVFQQKPCDVGQTQSAGGMEDGPSVLCFVGASEECRREHFADVSVVQETSRFVPG